MLEGVAPDVGGSGRKDYMSGGGEPKRGGNISAIEQKTEGACLAGPGARFARVGGGRAARRGRRFL